MKRNGKKARKIRKLVIACTLSAVVLIVSTYTWFIGLRTVSVNPFEIEIAATEGLYLSLDGQKWSYEVDVMDTTTYPQYVGNTNQLDAKLIPLSSVGDLDNEVSRMKLFEKASLTASHGGYRLLSSRVDNDTVTTTGTGTDQVTTISQGEGYIVFDLFIKNLSGNAYYHENEEKNEEGIYLNFDSGVKVETSGAIDQDKTGIENSVRVAFAQIGRVEATTTDTNIITKIDCEGTDMDGTGYSYAKGDVTGICRNAQIWEPNDTKHAPNAIGWYNTSCITRTGANITKYSSYNAGKDENGKQVSNPTYCYDSNTKAYLTAKNGTLPTYAISRVIDIQDNVDVYDGLEYNKYTGNTMSYKDYRDIIDTIDVATLETIESVYDPSLTGSVKTAADTLKAVKLVNYDYFTDTEKDLKGMERPEFMTLAPNSITKVRVYIWLEGQDIDNYDFAQLGKTISVNFGFTKERFLDTDVNYTDPMTSDNGTIPTTSEIAG